MGRALAAAAAALAALAICGNAVAQDQFPDITDRSYAIDLYSGAVLGSSRIVGMGGASVAIADGSAGILANPASVAAWPATSTDSWDWDWHFDVLNRLPGEDLDNNGIEDPTVETNFNPYLTFGAIGRWGVWAAGVTVSSNTEKLPTDDEALDLVARTNIIRLTIGAALFREQLSVGAAIRGGSLELRSDERLFQLNGAGVEIGALWTPWKSNLRIGASVSSPISGTEVGATDADCDPMNCQGYILPERVVAPWQASLGFAYRFGPTKWNQKLGMSWRDERSLILAGDVVVTGTSDDGHGLGAFALGKLQPSGVDTSLSVRLGAEYEWLPGRLRIRGGSYWEPSRFEGVSGRLHATLGVDVRVWTQCFWGDRYRLMLGLTGDGANGYGNGGISVGFW